MHGRHASRAHGGEKNSEGPRWRALEENVGRGSGAQAFVAGLTPGWSLKNWLFIGVNCFH
jgi:hypothetical protein